jgi:hypothetical protein
LENCHPDSVKVPGKKLLVSDQCSEREGVDRQEDICKNKTNVAEPEPHYFLCLSRSRIQMYKFFNVDLYEPVGTGAASFSVQYST